MDSVAIAALTSWSLDPRVIGALCFTGFVYCRGWVRIRKLVRHVHDVNRLACFALGLFLIFLATESPLDSLDNLFLSAHMTQHLLLMMFAPALLLLGHPMVPLLRGLPKTFVKQGLGPFLTWPQLRRFFAVLISPPVAWLIFAFSTLLWHVPFFYELALGSPRWHALQHASFFWSGVLFWWPVIRPEPSRYRWPQWIGIPYLIAADVLNTAISAFFIFSGKLLYSSYSAVHIGSLTAQDDQTLAGAIMWVPGSILYLIPVVVIATRLLSPQREMERSAIKRAVPRTSSTRTVNLPRWRRTAQIGMFALSVAVVADGWFGPSVTPLNLAGVLPWIHWRVLSVIALLLVGNLFCMACPFTFARDCARRLMPARLKWPRRMRTKWLPFAFIALYLWSYEAFALWNRPWVTACIVAGYFAAAILVDGTFRGASFCKYVCPIGQFHFVTSLVSPREVAIRSQAVCASCGTHDCIRGNERTRGCELYLFQPKKSSNLDCTFCLDCVKACPHDNVALLSIAPARTLMTDPYRSGIGRLSSRTDYAALALLVTFGAFVNAAGMLGPVIMWEHRLHAWFSLNWRGPNMMPAISGAFTFTGAVVLPILLVALCGLLSKLDARTTRRFVFALVPLGASMWLAHLMYHLTTSWSAAVPPVERLVAGAVRWFPAPTIPGWLTPVQILALDGGMLLSLYVFWRIARQTAPQTRSSILIVLPWAALSCALYAIGIWILFQPMQMRGMMMSS